MTAMTIDLPCGQRHGRGCRWLLALAVTSAVGAPAVPALALDDDQPDFSWLTGNWNVKYTDRLLGEVTGYAVVDPAPGGGPPLVRYVVEDPRTHQQFELGVTTVRLERHDLVIQLFGASPSAAVTAEGAAEATAAEGAQVIAIRGATTLQAALGSESTEAAVRGKEPIRASHTIRFPIAPANPATDYLDGRWKIVRDWRSGFRGLRSGVRDEEREATTALGEPIQFMSDNESWFRQGPRIDLVTIAEMDSFYWLAEGDQPRDRTRPLTAGVWLRIEGEDLPVERGERVRSVEFEDELVKWTSPASFRPDPEVPGALQIEVQLGVDVRPGRKHFTLDGAPGVWEFDFPGLDPKEIRYVRKIREGQYEHTRTLYAGEVYSVEVEFEYVPYYNERWFMTTGHGRGRALWPETSQGASPSGPVEVFEVKKTDESPRVFRSEEFLLLDALESLQAPWSSERVLHAQEGATLRTTAADAVRPNARRLWGEVRIGAQPQGRYQEALKTARELRERYPERERYEAERWVLVTSRSTYITVQDHAALILLSDELSDQISQYIDAATTAMSRGQLPGGIGSEQYRRQREAWARSLVRAADSFDDHMLFLYDVSTPDGSDTLPLDEALRQFTPESFPGQTSAEKAQAHLEYVLGAVSSAEGQAIGKAGEALAKLRDMDISQPTELLKAIGLGYDRVAMALMQKLLRPSVPANGEPFYPRWVPDMTGRAAVRGVGDLARTVKADEAYGSVVRMGVVVMTLPLLFAAAPAAATEAAAGTWGAARAFLTGAELANLALISHEMLEWDEASEDAEFARGNAVVAGTDAYRIERGRADAALLSALLNGGVSVGMPLFMRAAALGLRPSAASLEAAATEATRRGVEALGPETRAAFEYLRGRAEYRAAREGLEALTLPERQALRAAYPNGFPPEVAERMGLGAGEATQTLPPGLAPLSERAERAALSTVDDFAIDLRRAAPEQSSNPVMRRWYEGASEVGTPAARARRETLEAAEEMFQGLTPAQQGRAQEAMEILDRLRRTDPAMANIDDATAARMIMLHAKGERATAGGVFEALDPEEIAMRVATWNRVEVDPSDLAKAANISPMNAEAALGRARGWANRFEGGHGGGGGSGGAGAGESTLPLPSETTVTPRPPTATDVTHATNLRQERIESILRGMGMDAEQARHAAVVPAATELSARDAAAGAAMARGLPPSQVAESLGMTPEQLRAALGRYHRRIGWEPNRIRRAEMIDDYLNGELAPTEIGGSGYTTLPPPTLPSSTRRLPPALDGPVPSRDAVRTEVIDALEEMGIERVTAESLQLDPIMDRVGMDSRTIAAGVARRLGVDPRRASGALGTDPRGLAGSLDLYDEATQPMMAPSRRAREVAEYLGGGSETAPLRPVMEARRARVNDGLRDLGISRGSDDLVWEGVEVESAIVGNAMDNSVDASTLMARRGLSRERLASHADEYLRYGRGVTDPAERSAMVERYLEGTYEPANAAWRIPRHRAAAVATEDDVASALERMNVDPAMARRRAHAVRDLAGRDAHAGLAGAAMHSRVPPSTLRETFGMTNDQIAGKLDIYLRDAMGMSDPARRADYISKHYFGRHDGPKPAPNEVVGMIERAKPDTPPLHPRSTASASDPALRHRPTIEPPRRPARTLDERFGAAHEPRYVKTVEREGSAADGAVVRNPQLREINADRPWIIHPDVPYIWTVDEQGRLLLGVEQPVAVADGELLRLGHPTLTGGARARISGELKWDSQNGRWVINNLSGRYTVGHADRGYDQMRNVADLFDDAGLPVSVDFYPLP